MDIRKVPAEQLKAAKYNPRKDLKPGDEEYEKLRRSLEEFGYVEPVIWNKKTGNIVGGHQRFKILAEQGAKEIDCVVVDMDEQKEKALNIALNKISGEWDAPLLEDLLKDLSESGFDVSLTGFEAADLRDLVATDEDVKEDDFDATKALEEIKTPMSKRGDVWLLGKHRLMCGDSTSPDDVGVLMNGKKARHVFTDPPWNVDYGSSTNHPSWKSRSIMNDSMPTDQFKEFMEKTFSAMKAVCEPGCMTYIVMSAQEWGNLMKVLTEAGYHWSSTVIWRKDSLVLSRKDYHTQYEPIWYGWLEGSPRLVPLEDRKQSDVWDIPRPKRSEEHPTMKPIALVAKAIQNSSHKGDLVLDLFGGSGTTLLASDQTERICHMMELDPKYADVIVKRYIESTGNSAGVFLLCRGEKIAWENIKQD
ncbi:site-specific DNA-methyltransferase [Desulfosporosinus sp. Sb-LF]|uniref:site-specific DNA-methyltransferase n=1 Tax=Desulfosporosinus sp. Sb-LF TaxID=2560027 RepID=UPI00107F028C|nr:site-specific DNA-methyltransferase [Desulfosporosinus sp. Sb-LF]TGE33338.1 DNA modification methylase [Desulfosporosinus sp. Sb-LF]